MPRRAGRAVLRAIVVMAAVGLGVTLARRREANAPERSPGPDSALAVASNAMADSLALLGAPDVATPDDAIAVTSGLPAPLRDSARIAFVLEGRGPGTYVPELLAARDGWNFRWPDRNADPLRIWVQTASGPGWDDAFPALVREGFSAWEGLGLPLLLTVVLDSSRAEVLVTWVDRFPERMTGRTMWRHDQNGWIVGGTLELALHLPDGRPVTRDGVRAIARHEVGHLLGLDHPRDTTSVMAAQVYVTELSARDRRSVQLVYELPPGRILP